MYFQKWDCFENWKCYSKPFCFVITVLSSLMNIFLEKCNFLVKYYFEYFLEIITNHFDCAVSRIRVFSDCLNNCLNLYFEKSDSSVFLQNYFCSQTFIFCCIPPTLIFLFTIFWKIIAFFPSQNVLLNWNFQLL